MKTNKAISFGEVESSIAEITGEDISESIGMIKKYSKPYGELLYRNEQRQHLLEMITGLTSDLERKTVEPIATMHGIPRYTLQHFIGCSNWDCEPLLELLHKQITKEIGIQDGVLVFDGSSTQKKGKQPLA